MVGGCPMLPRSPLGADDGLGRSGAGDRRLRSRSGGTRASLGGGRRARVRLHRGRGRRAAAADGPVRPARGRRSRACARPTAGAAPRDHAAVWCDRDGAPIEVDRLDEPARAQRRTGRPSSSSRATSPSAGSSRPSSPPTRRTCARASAASCAARASSSAPTSPPCARSPPPSRPRTATPAPTSSVSTRSGCCSPSAVAPDEADDPQLAYGFLLHDVGKLGVPDAVLTQARPAERRRVAADAPPPAGGRADPRGGAVPAPRRRRRAAPPRALGRPRLPRRACEARGDPAVGAHLRRRRHRRRDRLRPSRTGVAARSSTRSTRSSRAPGTQFDPDCADAMADARPRRGRTRSSAARAEHDGQGPDRRRPAEHPAARPPDARERPLRDPRGAPTATAALDARPRASSPTSCSSTGRCPGMPGVEVCRRLRDDPATDVDARSSC